MLEEEEDVSISAKELGAIDSATSSKYRGVTKWLPIDVDPLILVLAHLTHLTLN